jgi:transcriptional regulator with XRE-family HTH domain
MTPTRTRGTTAAPLPHLREWRLYRTMTQRDLGTAAIVMPTAISMYETGTHNAAFRIMKRLADTLQISVDELRYQRPPVHQDYALDNETEEE